MGAFDERSQDALEWNSASFTSGGHDGGRRIERPGGTATASDQGPWPDRRTNSARRKCSAECEYPGCRQQGGRTGHSSLSARSSGSGDSSTPSDSGTASGPCTRNSPRSSFGPRSTGSSGPAQTSAANSSEDPGHPGAAGNPGTSQAAACTAASATTSTGNRADTAAAAGRPRCPSHAQTGKGGQPGPC